MKGNAKVIAALSELLAAELTSVDQYFVHSQMYHNWGYDKLFARIDHERQDEIEYATLLIKRILFRWHPCRSTPLRVGADVPEMLQFDLLTEYEVAAALKETHRAV